MIATQKTHSPSIEDYVKAVYKLRERGAPAVTTTGLAAHLDIAPSSVSGMVRKLGDVGLVHHARYGNVELTAAGRQLALDVVRRHRLIELYLVNELGYSWDEVHDEAEQLEHVVSPKLLDRIAERLGDPDFDPHGDPIPARDGTVTDAVALRLTELPAGTVGRLTRVSDDDPSLLRHLRGLGIVLGARVEVGERQPFGGPLLIRVGEPPDTTAHSLGHGATDAMSITVEP